MINAIRNLFTRPLDLFKAKQPDNGIEYVEVSNFIHPRMTGKTVDRSILEEEANDDLAVVLREAQQQFGLSDETVVHFRSLYRALFGALNNANPKLDRQAIETYQALGVNFNAVNEIGLTPRDIILSVIEHAGTSTEARRQASIDLAYLDAVIAGEALADEEGGE